MDRAAGPPWCTLNSPANPATLGSIVTVFATGTGVTSPASVEGAVATSTEVRPVEQVAVALGGIPAQTVYAGPSPGSLTSITQINLRLPDTLPSGQDYTPSAWPIQIAAGRLTEIVTIALKQ
jgi:uncharacterized protein (TIGR03437 family)